MPKKNTGSLATTHDLNEWAKAYRLYVSASMRVLPGQSERRARIEYAARQLGITPKQAKRRVRNYEGAYKNGNLRARRGEIEGTLPLPIQTVEVRPAAKRTQSAAAGAGSRGAQGGGPGRGGGPERYRR